MVRTQLARQRLKYRVCLQHYILQRLLRRQRSTRPLPQTSASTPEDQEPMLVETTDQNLTTATTSITDEEHVTITIEDEAEEETETRPPSPMPLPPTSLGPMFPPPTIFLQRCISCHMQINTFPFHSTPESTHLPTCDHLICRPCLIDLLDDVISAWPSLTGDSDRSMDLDMGMRSSHHHRNAVEYVANIFGAFDVARCPGCRREIYVWNDGVVGVVGRGRVSAYWSVVSTWKRFAVRVLRGVEREIWGVGEAGSGYGFEEEEESDDQEEEEEVEWGSDGYGQMEMRLARREHGRDDFWWGV